jgi:hypothetical protein
LSSQLSGGNGTLGSFFGILLGKFLGTFVLLYSGEVVKAFGETSPGAFEQ